MLEESVGEESVMARHVGPGYELIITCPRDLLEESVVYQDIFQKGFARGLRKAALRQLAQRCGKLSLRMHRQLEQLAVEQLEALCDALPDFQTKADLTRWLKQHAPAR